MTKSDVQLLITSCFLLWIGISSCGPSGSAELRVLTYNLHHGETIEGRMDLEAMAAVIRSARPHLVALQEVDIHTRRVGGVSLLDELVASCGMEGYFAKALDHDGGQYGNAILSAYPIVEAATHLLPSSEDREQRVAAACLIVLPHDTIRFIATHFDHVRDSTDRLRQAQELFDLFSNEHRPSILAGDLNDVPESEPLRILKKYWSTSAPDSAFTSPAPNPRRKIDYILYQPKDRWQVVSSTVLPDAVSDHFALLTVFRLD